MTGKPRAPAAGTWTRVIGIVGGLGPHAHIRFEELLLRAAEARTADGLLRDQDYPPYLVSSLPGTPDRTEYVLGRGPSPLAWLERSLRALRGAPAAAGDTVRADFAVIACNAAHALLADLRAREILPILDLVAETVASIRTRGPNSGSKTVGLLATTGTLEARIYQRALALAGLTGVSLLDLAGGVELQRSLVMTTVYGDDERPGIKAGAHRDSGHRQWLLGNLEQAVARLAEAGAGLVITACTEIPLVLGPGRTHGIEVVDPLEIAARAAVAVAAGERDVERDP